METPNSIDQKFAALIERIATKPSADLNLAALLLSRFQADGHVCLPLRELTSDMPEVLAAGGRLPSRNLWLKKLRESGVVGAPGEFAPIILDGEERLYLQRYWRYETQVAAEVRQRLSDVLKLDAKRCSEQVVKIFTRESELQMLAALVAATSRICLISGAPGTGKTHTVVMVCALLLALNPECKIALAAPTGKAAARLKEALGLARTEVGLPNEIASRLPNEASTVQRLLGARGDSNSFRFNRAQPLLADVVIVDEASMIDLALLSRLFEAVRPEARLVLVGDKDQLASVEAGSAFRDLCTPGCEISVSEAQADRFGECFGKELEEAMPRVALIHDAVVELRENFRFAPGSGIVELSRAINRGDVAGTRETLKTGDRITWRPTPPMKALERALRERVCHHFRALRSIRDAAEALRKLNEFMVLCALRRGPFGSKAINELIKKLLAEASEAPVADQYFSGQPLMIVRNDYHLELFNGDIGIVLATDDGLRVFFPAGDGSRSFSLARLPEHETAFALTVHKSQGSEFREALLILPDRDAPVLTRELLYTAVTRVRERVEIWAGETILNQIISRRVRRSSGLRDSLWGAAAVTNY